ncbi:DUF2855 family protein [Sphingomonas sp.]|uniref:DUF2855 family protein n=1 Tax=Sphingomonas sp. TaxID=28214 RepID=UPI00286C1DE7|nr:DUF2855 family protein [Sphingomonas sp.]
MTDTRWAIDIDRDDIAKAALVDEPAIDLAPGEVEVRVECFAMTANNVTYAALGKPIGLFPNGKGYWDFFSPGGEGPGRLPVWGFATVTRSAAEGVDEGEQFYGFYPMASHVRLTPGRVNAGGFMDVAAHRDAMPAVYDHYLRVSALGDFVEADRDWWPVFRPLYLTGWLIADQFEDEADFGAAQVLVASASSKTAIGFAHAMNQRGNRPKLIGLTSSRGRDFLEGAGLYDDLILYNDIAALDPAIPSAFVDIAGDCGLTAALHYHFGEELKLNLVVGKAHWDSAPAARVPAVGFFAPARVAKRSKEWGPGGFQSRMATAWTAFLSDARNLFRIEVSDGPDAALAAYCDAVAGKADPRAGILVHP